MLTQLMILIFLIFLCKDINSENYYVDCEKGDDNSNGKSEASAWKTISQMNDGNYKAGDKIYLKRGCIFSTSISLSSLLGEKDNPIIISSYGNVNDPLPKIDGSYHLTTSWNKNVDGIWEADCARSNVNSLILNDRHLNVSHKPYHDDDFFYIKALLFNKIHVYDSFPFTKSEIMGSMVAMRPLRFVWVGSEIIDYDESNKIITVKYNISGKIIEVGRSHDNSKNFGFKLQNRYNYLNSSETGDWYFDATQQKLFLTLKEDPNHQKITIPSTSNSGIHLLDSRYIIFENLHVTKYYHNFKITGSNYTTIRNNEISLSTKNGIYITYHANGVKGINIENNLIYNSTCRGFYSAGWGKHFQFKISSNTITNIYHEAANYLITEGSNHGGGYDSGIGSPLLLNGHDSIIEKNKISYVANAGITFNGNRNIVQFNLINVTNLYFGDSGGVYCNTFNSYIRNNIFMNAVGNVHGTPFHFTSNGPWVRGIYIDSDGGYNQVYNNTVIGSEWGLIFNSQINNSFYGNNIYGTKNIGLWTGNVNVLSRTDNTGHQIYDNIIYTFNGVNHISDPKSLGCENHAFFKNNYYLSLAEKSPTCCIAPGCSYHWNKIGYNWYDINTYEYVKNETNIVFNSFFDTNKNGWSNGWDSEGTNKNKAAWDSNFGGCLKCWVEKSIKKTGDLLTGSNTVFEIRKDKKYEISFSLYSNDTDRIKIVVRKKISNFQVLGFNQYFDITTTLTTYKKQFTGTSDSDEAQIVIFSGTTPYAIYYFDNLTINEIHVSRTHDKEDDISIIYNIDIENEKNHKFKKNEIFCDVFGNKLPQTVKLGPLESKIIMSCGCNKDFICNNHENANSCPEDGCEPICGNFVCENGENIFNCPSDCKVDIIGFSLIAFFSFSFLVLLIVIIGVIVFLVIKYYNEKKKNKFGASKSASVVSDSEMIPLNDSEVIIEEQERTKIE